MSSRPSAATGDTGSIAGRLMTSGRRPLCANIGTSSVFGLLTPRRWTNRCLVPSSTCYAVAGAVLRTAKAGRRAPLTLRILQEFFRHDDGASDADYTPNVRAGLAGDGRCGALANLSACPGRLARPPARTLDPRGHTDRRARHLDHFDVGGDPVSGTNALMSWPPSSRRAAA